MGEDGTGVSDSRGSSRPTEDPHDVVLRLLSDSESEIRAEASLERDLEVEDRIRHEWSSIGLIDRVSAHLDCEIRVTVAGGETISGYVMDVGSDWIALSHHGLQTFIQYRAILNIRGLSSAADAGSSAQGSPSRRPFSQLARHLASDRRAIACVQTDGSHFVGTIERAGSDHLEIAVHPNDLPRRFDSVVESICLPYRALATVTLT